MICSQFELKDLNSVHVFEPLHFQQLEHSQSYSGSNDNPNSASMYSQLQHHKKVTGDSLEMFQLAAEYTPN